MMRLRLKSKREGDHIHVAVFMGDDEYALNGQLVFRESEYQAFRHTIAQGADDHKLVQFSEECDLR